MYVIIMIIMFYAAKYKTLEKLVNTTKLPALVEQKPVHKQTDDTRRLEVFEPLTLTETVQQKFLVVNFINDGKQYSIPNTSGASYRHWNGTRHRQTFLPQ